MTVLKRLCLGAAALMATTTISVLGTAAPASADVINYSCGPKLNPYELTTGSQREWLYAAKQGSGGADFYLSTNNPYYGRNVFWAWGHNLNPGDTISLDWSDDGARNWHACHKKVPSGAHSTTTYAVDNPGGRWFRTCVHRSGYSGWACTPWF
ncbi:hypothetical protein ACIRBX_24825 [Kitasatospora sp. NPDC096147]|uniref:hypothetical protein n=1 Tax=Kitasatospora sp. NPDC096147 TaxID=3364093 RepID=UPI00382514FF